jgi:hypothetical protein
MSTWILILGLVSRGSFGAQVISIPGYDYASCNAAVESATHANATLAHLTVLDAFCIPGPVVQEPK